MPLVRAVVIAGVANGVGEMNDLATAVPNGHGSLLWSFE